MIVQSKKQGNLERRTDMDTRALPEVIEFLEQLETNSAFRQVWTQIECAKMLLDDVVKFDVLAHLDPETLDEIASGRTKIERVKTARRLLNVSLRDAKEFVETALAECPYPPK